MNTVGTLRAVYSDQEMGNLHRFGMGRISTGEYWGIRIVPIGSISTNQQKES